MTSMAYNSASGLSGMLKSGHSHWDDAIVRNVEAAVELSTMVHTSMGPFGRHKLIVNHLEKLYITSDCHTILKELEVEHPAAKLLVMASNMQNDECGDATNLVVTFCGELLRQTQSLMRMGLHPSEVISGYQTAADKVAELLPKLVSDTVLVKQQDDEKKLLSVISPVLQSKHYGTHQTLAPLILEACQTVMNKANYTIQPEAVRVVKLLGSSVGQSILIPGYVAQRGVDSNVKSAQDAKVVVFACGIEASSTEAKGTVLLKTADDLKGYNLSEETKMEEMIQGIANSGVKVLVTGGNVSEMALHFIDRYQLVCLKIGSKWELRRLCRATGATALVRLGAPTPDEMGFCTSVQVQHVGGRTLTVFETPDTGKLATLVLRASTTSVLQDLERAVDDGVRAFEQLCRDGRVLPGAGATEMALSLKLQQLADVSPGLDQYAIRAFAKALEVVPRTLADTAGLDATKIVADLNAAHANGNGKAGVNLEEGKVDSTDVVDLLNTKTSAFTLAVDAALTVLRVDQIIMSKQAGAGGPPS